MVALSLGCLGEIVSERESSLYPLFASLEWAYGKGADTALSLGASNLESGLGQTLPIFSFGAGAIASSIWDQCATPVRRPVMTNLRILPDRRPFRSETAARAGPERDWPTSD